MTLHTDYVRLQQAIFARVPSGDQQASLCRCLTLADQRSNNGPMINQLDIIYDRTIADEKLKSGTKYERLAALFFNLLAARSAVVHNLRLTGDRKETAHQIDVVISHDGIRHRVLVECRDFSAATIGLDQVRAFNGVLVQLQPATGIVLTTVGYTTGALSYGRDEGIIFGRLRAFEPSSLRAFEEQDWNGRVRQVNLEIHAYVLGTPQVSWTFVDPADALVAQQETADFQTVPVADVLHYDLNGRPAGSLSTLLSTWFEGLRVPLDGERGHQINKPRNSTAPPACRQLPAAAVLL